MVTKCNPRVLKVHYGDPNREDGAIGGDMISPGLQGYSFIIERGAGVDLSNGAVRGREHVQNLSLYRDGMLVAESDRNAPEGMKVTPSAYRDWRAFQILEQNVQHMPAKEAEKDAEALRDVFGNYRGNLKGPDRDD